MAKSEKIVKEKKVPTKKSSKNTEVKVKEEIKQPEKVEGVLVSSKPIDPLKGLAKGDTVVLKNSSLTGVITKYSSNAHIEVMVENNDSPIIITRSDIESIIK